MVADSPGTLETVLIPRHLPESERICLDEELGVVAHPLSLARPRLPMAEGAPRFEAIPVATDAIGAQFRAWEYIVKILSSRSQFDPLCLSASHRGAMK